MKKILFLALILAATTFANNATKIAFAKDIYKDGSPCNCDSLHRSFIGNNTLITETPYVHQKKHGFERSYSKTGEKLKENVFENGVLLAVINFKNGIRDGDYIEFHSNGTVRGKMSYVNGQIHGIKTLFDNEGHMQLETPYVNGKIHGKQKFYYPNGNLMKEITYENDVVVGDIIYYNEDGTVNFLNN